MAIIFKRLFIVQTLHQWVKENIDKFGGDPGKVTIFGEDSGAASVTLMAMSPPAQGLFHGAIALSGNLGKLDFQRQSGQESK